MTFSKKEEGTSISRDLWKPIYAFIAGCEIMIVAVNKLFNLTATLCLIPSVLGAISKNKMHNFIFLVKLFISSSR